jgi:hypothetical protein
MLRRFTSWLSHLCGKLTACEHPGPLVLRDVEGESYWKCDRCRLYFPAHGDYVLNPLDVEKLRATAHSRFRALARVDENHAHARSEVATYRATHADPHPHIKETTHVA